MATTKEIYDRVAFIAMLVIGILLFVLAINSYKHVSIVCPDNNIRNSITAIMALGAGMTTAGICYWVCIINSKNCYGSSEYSGHTAEIYYGIGSLLSLIIIVCSSIVLSGISKYGENCGGEKLKEIMVLVMVLSIICLVACSLGGYFAAFGVPAWMKDKSDEKVGGGRGRGGRGGRGMEVGALDMEGGI